VQERSHQAELARLVVAAAAVLVLSGCWWGGSSPAALRDGARSLVPPGSRIVEQIEADCIELARSPSCVHIYYIAEAEALRERVRAVEQAAAAAGWRAISREFLLGGANLRFSRERLTASVYIWAEKRAAPCRHAPARDCADVVMVE
jgi:hypothetical protein